MGTKKPIEPQKIFPEEIPMSLILADYSDEEKILLWDVNVISENASGCGGPMAYSSNAGGGSLTYMVATSAGFYSSYFNFQWDEQVDERNRFYGYVGDREVDLASWGSPDNPRDNLQFSEVDWNDDHTWWTNTGWLFKSSNPDLSEAFHNVITHNLLQAKETKLEP
jgi:hypothetical protein